MKSISVFIFSLFVFCNSYSQVGVNTISPNAQLDIEAMDEAIPLSTDGLLIPRIQQFPTTDPTALQDAMLVYLKMTDGADAPGFYYWNQATTSWIGIPGPKIEKIDDLLDGKSDTGGSSVFLGVESGSQDNGTNNQSVGVGYQSLQNTVNSFRNVGIGYRALQNTTSNNNIGIGYSSLLNNTSGLDNVAIGSSSMSSNVAGRFNVAIGFNSLSSNTASSNTAVGNRSLESNTTGKSNNALGNFSLRNTTTGSFNNAMGDSAMANNTTGSLNSAFGNTALRSNTTGSTNVAFGARSLTDNTTGIDNVAIGVAALFKSTTASRNVAIGSGTLGDANLSGDRNIGIVVGALSHNTTGTNNIAIGDKASRFTNNSNTVTIGNSSHNTYLMYAASWTQASDRSLKHGIKEIPVGLDFVKQLNPVEFIYNNAAKETDKTFGFIAQEIDALVKKSDINGNVIVGNITDDLLGLKQVELIPVLTKAIQEQQTHIKNLEEKLEMLSKKMDTLLKLQE